MAKPSQPAPSAPEIPKDGMEKPLDATVLDEFEQRNVLAIDRMQKVVDRLKDMTDTPKKKKILYIRLGLYIIQMVIIMLICSALTNPWVAIIVSVLLAYVTTIGINIIVKKLEIKENMGEITLDTKRTLIQSIINSIPLMPPIIQNNIVSFVYKGETAKRYKDIESLKQYKKTMERFLQARRDYRSGDIASAERLIIRVIAKSRWSKFTDLLNEALPFEKVVRQQIKLRRNTMGKRSTSGSPTSYATSNDTIASPKLKPAMKEEIKVVEVPAPSKKVVDEAAAKKKAEADAFIKKKAEDETAAKKKAETDALAKKKAEDEAAAKKKAETDALAKKKVEDEVAAKKKVDDEGAAKKVETSPVADTAKPVAIKSTKSTGKKSTGKKSTKKSTEAK